MGNSRFQIGRRLVPGDNVMRLVRSAQRSQRSSFPIRRQFAQVTRYRLARNWGVYLHQSAVVGEVHFAHPTSIIFGAGVRVEDGVTIFQNVTLGAVDVASNGYPVIRSGATLFAGASILGGIEIGPGATVGAHSLVLTDVPAGATAVGIPARVIGHAAAIAP